MSLWSDLLSSLSNAEDASPEVKSSNQHDGIGGAQYIPATPSTPSIKQSPRSSPFPPNLTLGDLSSYSSQYYYDSVSPAKPDSPFPQLTPSSTPSFPFELSPQSSAHSFNQNIPLQHRVSLPVQPPQGFCYPLSRTVSSKDVKQESFLQYPNFDLLSPTSFQQARVFDWPNMSGGRDSAPDTASPFSTEQTDQEAFSPEQLRSLLQAINDGSISLPASMPVTPLPAASSARAGRSRHYSAAGVNAPTASPALTPRRPPVASSSSSSSTEGTKRALDTSSEHKKRRYTLPDSLRAYHRALEEGTVEDGQPTSSDPVKSNVILQSPVKTAVKHKAPVSNTRRRFRKIEDVESDLSDNGNEGGPSNTSSSVAGDHDSDMPLDKTSRKSSGASVARNKPQNAAISQSTTTSASDINSCKMGGVELAIVRQPESHHRARYQKEGSRGCIKDRTGSSCPSVQLKGYSGKNLIIQAYIGTETDPIRPHPLYRVCKVGGKHSTPCREKVLDDGITCLEMDLLRENNYTLNIDCLGILKLRNADFTSSVVDAEEMTKRRKRSPKVRLAIRCPLVELPDGLTKTFQVISSPISCTPSPGVPEVHFISHSSCPVTGEIDVVVIGRNYVKDDSRLYIAEKRTHQPNNSDGEEGENMDSPNRWEMELNLLQEHFSPVHLVGTIPTFHDLQVSEPVDVLVYVRNKGGKTSEGYPFKYTPVERRQERSPASIKAQSISPSPPSSLPLSVEAESSEELMNLTIDIDTDTNPLLPLQCLTTESIGPFTPIQPVRILPQPIMAIPTQSVDGQMSYCIQLPGIQQPIVITVPQNHQQQPSVAVVQPPPAYNALPPPAYNQQLGDAHNVQHFQASQVGQQQYSQNPVDLLDTVVASSSMLRNSVNPAAVGLRDEDLFDELLKEILGPDSDMSELMALMQQEGILAAAGSSSNRNAEALSSLLALNINTQRQYNPDGLL